MPTGLMRINAPTQNFKHYKRNRSKIARLGQIADNRYVVTVPCSPIMVYRLPNAKISSKRPILQGHDPVPTGK